MLDRFCYRRIKRRHDVEAFPRPQSNVGRQLPITGMRHLAAEFRHKIDVTRLDSHFDNN